MNRRRLLQFLTLGGILGWSNSGGAEESKESRQSAKSSADEPLTIDEFYQLMKKDDHPYHRYGQKLKFTAKTLEIRKAVDGATVPIVEFTEWQGDTTLYGRAYLHNISADALGKVGDLNEVEGMIVQQAYGVWVIWTYKFHPKGA